MSYPTVFGMQVSTVLGVAIKEEREQNAWSEGVAIWVAVVVVSLVGEHTPASDRRCTWRDQSHDVPNHRLPLYAPS